MENARWKDKIFAEEYAREEARAKFRVDHEPKKKKGLYQYLIPTLVLIITGYMVVSFAEIFGTTGSSLLSFQNLLPFVIIFAFFLYLIRT